MCSKPSACECGGTSVGLVLNRADPFAGFESEGTKQNCGDKQRAKVSAATFLQRASERTDDLPFT